MAKWIKSNCTVTLCQTDKHNNINCTFIYANNLSISSTPSPLGHGISNQTGLREIQIIQPYRMRHADSKEECPLLISSPMWVSVADKLENKSADDSVDRKKSGSSPLIKSFDMSRSVRTTIPCRRHGFDQCNCGDKMHASYPNQHTNDNVLQL